MLARFWGTRGSIATAGSTTLHFGGNTSCVEVVTNAGKRFIFDCGTGVRALGGSLLSSIQSPIHANILFTHTHWDHIQGFPFFVPLFMPGNRFTVSGPKGAKGSLQEVLAGQMEYTYFPVELGALGAQIEYLDVDESLQEVDGVRVTAQFLNHPAITLGYKIEADGATLLYLCDHEPFWETLWKSEAEPGKLESILHKGDLRHAAFMAGADVVIHDAQYTSEEYLSKKNWGHSTYSYVTQIAAAAGVKRLLLTHHDPGHNDAFLQGIEDSAKELAACIGSPIAVQCAFEGLEVAFGRNVDEPAHSDETHPPEPVMSGSLLILIVDDDPDLRLLARRILTTAGHRVMEAAGGAEGLALLQKHSPDLLLLDLSMPAPDGFEVLRELRSREPSRLLPVVVLTAHGDEDSVRISFELGATDYLHKPFTPPQLDARVRSCFAHAPRG